MSELREQILALRLAGLPYSEIQKQLGCSKGTISYYLGTGQKEKTQRRQNVSRGKFRVKIQQIKQDSACADCKENYPYWIMDFDHLEDKSFNISNMVRVVGCNEDLLMKEVAKCEIVCANCHRNRTHLRKQTGPTKDMIDVEDYY